MTPHLDVVGLLPEITLATTLAIVFVADLFVGERHKYVLQVLSFVGVVAALCTVVGLSIGGATYTMVGGTYVVDHFSLLAKGIFLASAAVVFLLGMPSTWRGEYFVLLLSSLLGMVLIPSSRDLLLFFVSFELLAVPGYMLAGWRKRSEHGHESALKYYLLGVLATAVMLYGLSLIYGLAGTTSFNGIATFFQSNGDGVPLARLALFFVIVGMAFKVSAVPFHFWAPDVYQGAPLPVTAYLSVASKSAGVIALLNFLAVAVRPGDEIWAPVLWVLAVVTMLVGNIAALRQTDVVRLLAYSSIAQAGYILIPLAAAGSGGIAMDDAIKSTFTYLLIYAAMSLGAFAAVIAITRRTGATSTASLRGLFNSAPALAVVLTVHVLSLAGVPPFGGWFAKLIVVQAAINAGGFAGVSLAVVAAISTAIGLVYYAVLVRQLWLQPTEVTSTSSAEAGTAPMVIAALAVTTAFVVLSGVLPGVASNLGGFSSLAG